MHHRCEGIRKKRATLPCFQQDREGELGTPGCPLKGRVANSPTEEKESTTVTMDHIYGVYLEATSTVQVEILQFLRWPLKCSLIDTLMVYFKMGSSRKAQNMHLC